jgi:tetratricopeptide (TPR) repeat protein
MLVANCAWLLAQAGHRVLMVDWDLEAPGLHRYFAPFLTDPQLMDSDGVVDLVVKYAAAAVEPQAESASDRRSPDWFYAHADVLDYAVSINWTFERGGTLSLMPAGRQGPTYAARMNTFGWNNFYDRLGGYSLIEALKSSMRKEFDFVLVDSRTGVSDTAGICTVQLPDKLVVCFTLNNQSIEGAAAVARSVIKQKAQAGFDIFPIPTRIDNSESIKLNERWRIAKNLFNDFPRDLPASGRAGYWDAVAVQYVPSFAYEEVLAAFANRADDPPTVNLAALTARILGVVFGVKAAAEPMAEDVRLNVLDHYAGRGVEATPAQAQRQAEQAHKHSQDELTSVAAQVRLQVETEYSAKTKSVTSRARWLTSLISVAVVIVAAAAVWYQREATIRRANTISNLIATGESLASGQDWTQALTSFNSALALDPKNVTALGDRAQALGQVGKWSDALADWNQAVTLQPDQLSLRQQRAAALLNSGSPTGALQDIQYVLQKEPANLAALQVLAQVDLAMGRPTDATAAYSEILKQQPDDAPTLVARARAYKASGNKAQAVEDFTRVIKVADPRSSYAVFAQSQLANLGVKLPSGPSSTAEVTPVVYIQYSSAQDARYADEVSQALKSQHLDVPTTELTVNAPTHGEIRYYFPQDLEVAGRVREVVQKTLAMHDFLILLAVRQLDTKQFPKAKPGLIEVWLPALGRNVVSPNQQIPVRSIQK